MIWMRVAATAGERLAEWLWQHREEFGPAMDRVKDFTRQTLADPNFILPSTTPRRGDTARRCGAPGCIAIRRRGRPAVDTSMDMCG